MKEEYKRLLIKLLVPLVIFAIIVAEASVSSTFRSQDGQTGYLYSPSQGNNSSIYIVVLKLPGVSSRTVLLLGIPGIPVRLVLPNATKGVSVEAVGFNSSSGIQAIYVNMSKTPLASVSESLGSWGNFNYTLTYANPVAIRAFAANNSLLVPYTSVTSSLTMTVIEITYHGYYSAYVQYSEVSTSL